MYNVLDWIRIRERGEAIGLYCADVAGAFDRVDSNRLLFKLRKMGVQGKCWYVIHEWLRPRRAEVVVEGVSSPSYIIENAVFQGTALGPPLWNCFSLIAILR